MSTKEREPLLSNEQMKPMLLTDVLCIKVQDARMRCVKTGYGLALGASLVRDFYEVARAKDAELIQMAVNLTHQRVYEWTDEEFRAVLCDEELTFLAAAKEAGFTPSEP